MSLKCAPFQELLDYVGEDISAISIAHYIRHAKCSTMVDVGEMQTISTVWKTA